MQLNRRNFLFGSAAAASLAGVAAPTARPPRIRKAGERPTLAAIGMGMQQRRLLHQFLGQDVVVVGICDVDRTRCAWGVQVVEDYYKSRPELGIATGACKGYADFREVLADPGIDMVSIATPDHWHAYITLEAFKAGKDVYCEKPLTHSIEEAKLVMAGAEKYGRILQVGAMQRSSFEFRIACEIVRNGGIGKVRHVDANFGSIDPELKLSSPSQPHRFFRDPANAASEGAPNPDVDWDMWVGGAPWTPYSDELSVRGIPETYPMFWRHDDYFGSGDCGDWGAHHLDIAQWGLGLDDGGPLRVVRSDVPHSTNPIHGGRRQWGTTLEMQGGALVHHNLTSVWSTVFYGTDGIVAVNRGNIAVWTGSGVEPTPQVRDASADGSFDGMKTVAFYTRQRKEQATKELGLSCLAAANKAAKAFDLKHAKTKLYKSQNHCADFVARFLDRKKACSNETVGGRATILCQLCNLSYIYDTGFGWDPVRNEFAQGEGDANWLRRPYYRNGWEPKLG